MIDSQVLIAAFAAAGTVGAGGIAAIKAVYSRMSDRADTTDSRIVSLSSDLVDCHKQHAESSERIGKLEGWRDGWDAHREQVVEKPASETDTA